MDVLVTAQSSPTRRPTAGPFPPAAPSPRPGTQQCLKLLSPYKTLTADVGLRLRRHTGQAQGADTQTERELPHFQTSPACRANLCVSEEVSPSLHCPASQTSPSLWRAAPNQHPPSSAAGARGSRWGSLLMQGPRSMGDTTSPRIQAPSLCPPEYPTHCCSNKYQ